MHNVVEPQNDLLGHKNTKISISQCGGSGQFEALYHAIPMIGLPVMGDQHYNALRMQQKGFGIIFNVMDFTSDDLLVAIQEILKEPSYKDNIRKASDMFKSRPLAPGKRALGGLIT